MFLGEFVQYHTLYLEYPKIMEAFLEQTNQLQAKGWCDIWEFNLYLMIAIDFKVWLYNQGLSRIALELGGSISWLSCMNWSQTFLTS